MKNLVLCSFFCLLIWVSYCHADSKVGEIKRIEGDFAFINLGKEEGLKSGLRGEVLREEIQGGQLITIKVADLKIKQVFVDSTKIEILMRLSPIMRGDKVRVDDVNHPPVLESIGMQTLSENSSWSISLSAEDPDGDDLLYFVEEPPHGASFDSQSGEFKWKPDKNQSGTYTIRFGVSDGLFEDVEDVPVTVLDAGGGIPKWVWGALASGGAGIVYWIVTRNGTKDGTVSVTVTINP